MNLEANYKKYLDRHFIEFFDELRDRTTDQLMDYQVPFNLNEKYNHAFLICKKKLSPIIRHIHVNLARSNSMDHVLDEE